MGKCLTCHSWQPMTSLKNTRAQIKERFKETTRRYRKEEVTSLVLACGLLPGQAWVPPERRKGKGRRQIFHSPCCISQQEKETRVCLKPEDLNNSLLFLTAVGPIEYSDILQLLAICEHIQMAATSNWSTFRKKVINSQLVHRRSSTKNYDGSPEQDCSASQGSWAPLKLTKSWLLSFPGREKIFILEKKKSGSEYYSSPSPLCL